MAPLPGIEKPSLPENVSGVLRSVEDVRALSASLSGFISAWDGLHRSINSINTSLDNLEAGSNPKASVERKDPEKVKSDGSHGQVPTVQGVEQRGKKTVEVVGEGGVVVNGDSMDVDSICSTAVGKNLRKYINTNKDSNPEEFRAMLSSALGRAPNPAKLVINCLGGIYLQGKRAFSDPKSNAVAHLQDSIIAFELFLQSGRVVVEEQLEESLRNEASEVAVKWRKRLVVFEGGIADSNDADIIGLSLFIACLGIPQVFKSHDVYQMLHLCDLKQKTKLLKLSPLLLAKLPGIIQDLRKNNKHLAAAELVILYDLKEKFPILPLLKSFLDNAKKSGVDERRKSQHSYRSLKDSCEKNLSELKSLTKLLTDHGFDLKDFATLKLEMLMVDFEKQITKFDQKLQTMKRKHKETSHLSQTPSYMNTSSIYQPSQSLYYGSGGGGYPELPPTNHPSMMGPPGTSFAGNMGPPPPGFYNNWPPSQAAGEIAASHSSNAMDYAPSFPGSYSSTTGNMGSTPSNLYNFADRL